MLIGMISNAQTDLPLLKVSANQRYFVTADNKPFFWMGDTGWLLFYKLKREEAIQYLEDRKRKGFNVIQVMVVHDLKGGVNAYGDSSLHNRDIAQPKITEGNSFNDEAAYDFWDNVDYVIDEAAKRGIYMALVPLWGGNVKFVTETQAKTYATFLAERYRNKTNIVWLNGGDIKGSDALGTWNAIGKTLKLVDKNHLVGFHPRGRNSSSEWFHNEPWLDFNMFQSGHKSYAQDTSSNETLHYGEDNWRYVNHDYNLQPTKPTFDGEPSYEGIPYGLHDGKEPYWTANEIRRYAYWSVFAGACGFTYGHNAVMQFHKMRDTSASFFPKISWREALNAEAAGEMQYLKQLMLSRSYLDRVPDQNIVADNGEKYRRVLATRGKKYALFYTYNGRDFKVVLGRISGQQVKAYWYGPAEGKQVQIGKFKNKGTRIFNPPGNEQNGNDWVLVLESI
ncbi:MAG: glycoside hydrolase [Ferruginibacter sp.]|nr:glycoside hydrolase [Ferruginibacter sp.]